MSAEEAPPPLPAGDGEPAAPAQPPRPVDGAPNGAAAPKPHLSPPPQPAAAPGGAPAPGEPREHSLVQALVLYGQKASKDAPKRGQRIGYSDSESEEEAPAPIGPLDPERCSASGQGYTGASAGLPVKLVILAKDETGRRIREGGAYVRVWVEPASATSDAEPVEAAVTDHKDGSYSASYTIAAKGNYNLHIEINGEPMGGSPAPIFFGAPDPEAIAKAQAEAAAAAALQAQMEAAAAAARAQPEAGALPDVSAAVLRPATAFEYDVAKLVPGAADALAAGGAAAPLGAQALQAGMAFPDDAEALGRAVLVGGLSPLVTPEALQGVLAFAGTVRGSMMAGAFGLVLFASPAEAAAAVAASGMQVAGQAIRVEHAAEAKAAAAAAAAAAANAANPYLALQMQQAQHFQLLQAQQEQLAHHVVQLRAMSRAGINPAAMPGMLTAGADEASRAAALAAAQALAKRLAGGGKAEVAPAEAEDRRHRDRDRGRDRGGDRGRDRGKDRRRSRSRSRSRDRDRDRRGKQRRSRSRDRRTSGSSRRDRSRSRDRKQRRHDGGKGSSRDNRRRRDKEGDRGDKRGSAEPPEVAATSAAAKAQPADELEELFAELGD